jgi:thermitase
VIMTCLMMGILWVATPASQGQSLESEFAEGRVLVKFMSGATATEQVDALAQRDLVMLREIADAEIQVLDVPAGREREMADWLLSTGLVEYAAPDYVAHVTSEPNDDHWALQWNMTLVNAPAGWDIITGTNTITIAVLDTGIDLDHPDLVSKLVPGSNPLNYDTPPDDDHGHGTHVAAIAGAATNNWMGVAGVDWQARLMPVKVCDADSSCFYSDVIDGIYYAANNGARVINLSMAGWEPFEGLQVAVRYATDTKGALVVVSAGNCASGGDGCPGVNPVAYPASYTETIAVASATRYDGWASYSEYHSYVDIAAPGGDVSNPIWSADINGSYYSRHGTSMSAAHVSGLASLIWALNPGLSPTQVWNVMRDTADKVGPYAYINGRNNYMGYGRIDVAAALSSVAPTLVVSPTSVSFLAGNNRPLPSSFITIANDSDYSSMTWSASLSAGGSRFQIVAPNAGVLAPGESTQLEVRPWISGATAGTYHGELRIISTSRGAQGTPQTVGLKLSYIPQLHLALLPSQLSAAGGVAGYEWLDARAGGIALTLLDDDSVRLNLPFAFPFYGKTHTHVWVSSNGFITFGESGASGYYNRCLPYTSAPNNAIYAFWDDLDPSAQGGVYVKTVDSQTYVVQWDGVPHSSVGGGLPVTETFQIVLKSDGSIKLQYQTVGEATSCTVGVEDATGSAAQQLLCDGVGEALRDKKVFWLTTP